MIKTAIVVPSLNPDEKFNNVVDGMIAGGFSNIVLVDDGSDEAHKAPFELAMKHPECSLIVHPVNKGKGAALRDAFAYIHENLPDVELVVTVDGDGQHTPVDAGRLAEAAEKNPGKVIMGCRDFSQSHVPTHNRLGNRISSFIYNAVYGIKLSDTQTGLRAIPASCLEAFATKVKGDRYEYETNMLIYMKDNGIDYAEVPIQTVYIDDNSSSHFRIVRDSYRIYKPIILFVAGSVIATVVDIVLFTILNALTNDMKSTLLQLLIATGVARVVSSIVDYTFSRNHVFKPEETSARTVVRYYSVCISRMILSWLGVSGLTLLFGAEGLLRTLLKIIIDLILFFLSYRFQREWVFK